VTLLVSYNSFSKRLTKPTNTNFFIYDSVCFYKCTFVARESPRQLLK